MKNNLFKMLKVCLPLILLFAGLAAMGLEKGPQMDQGLPDEDKMLYQFINRQGKILGKKYHLIQSGNGLGGMDKVWLMSISFDRYGDPLSEKEARSLLVQCVEDFLAAVNSDEQLKPLLRDYPFTAKNLDLDIFNFDKDHTIHYFPHIALVSNSRGKVGFFTEDPSNVYGYYTEKYETYDEAVAILKGQNQAEGSK
jgi:hypothetical protein